MILGVITRQSSSLSIRRDMEDPVHTEHPIDSNRSIFIQMRWDGTMIESDTEYCTVQEIRNVSSTTEYVVQ